MITIKEILCANKKEQITLDVMGSLPEWFSPPEEVPAKARHHREMPFFAAYKDKRCIGFCTLQRHNPYTAEIYHLGVLKPFQRLGAGHLLVEACLQRCQQEGLRYLTVKTLDESANYEPYERTRAFYRKEGFLPLEMMPDYWNAENPCLFLIRLVEEATD